MIPAPADLLKISDWWLRLFGLLVVWTGIAYWIHRLAHRPGWWNVLHRIHRAHHRPDYLDVERRLRWHHFLFCFDTFSETMDVWITLTLPALLICLLAPTQGLFLLGFHYFYEIFLSDARLDHNPSISEGRITRWLACGQYHLEHHRHPSCRFGLILTLWDVVFGSAHPHPGDGSSGMGMSIQGGGHRARPHAFTKRL